MNRLAAIAGVAFLCSGFTISAQNSNAPTFHDPVTGTDAVIMQMSNNGRWGVMEVGSTTEGSIITRGGRLVDIDNPGTYVEFIHESGFGGASDVTDDGKIVVGMANMKPAYYNTDSKTWTYLPLPKGYVGGSVRAVTPDGHYACGQISPTDSEWTFFAAMWDLTTNSLVSLTNIPTLDMQGLDQQQNTFSAISPDGRYLLGHLSQSYMMPVALCTYVYDVQNQTFKFIGFDVDNYGPGITHQDWTPWKTGLHHIEGGEMSPNGEWVGGEAYVVTDSDEYQCAYKYNIATGEFTVYDSAVDSGTTCFSIDNNGNVFAGSPANSPYSTAMVRSGNYFISFDEIFKQLYGLDLTNDTKYPVSGKPCNVSDDGKTFVMIYSNVGSYILKLKEDIVTAASRVNLLGDYTVSPSDGSTFASVSNIELTFTRNIEVRGDKTDVELRDKDGNVVRTALKIDADGHLLTVIFRKTDIPQGETYTVHIPAGTISIKGDKDQVNKDIDIQYVGRGNGAVKVVQTYPLDNARLKLFDYANSPLTLTFDTQIKASDDAEAYLYRVDQDGAETQICPLNIATGGNQALIYPTAGQKLHLGFTYIIRVNEGSFTDLSGAGASDSFELHIEGVYADVPDEFAFRSECSNYDNWLFYEGDHRNPNSIPLSWGFTAETTPWRVCTDEGSSDMAFGSHSMYTPAGKADDWVMTYQINVPDNTCTFEFDAQSFMKDCKDKLKVLLLEADEVYLEGNEAKLVERFRNEGVVIFDDYLSPGANEDILMGEFTHYAFDFSKYDGKSIYLAFVNENDDQSAIFIDNVYVRRRIDYAVTVSTPEAVVAQESVPVTGSVKFNDEIATYNRIDITLTDVAGREISKFSETGDYKKGSTVTFSFPDPLPLKAGEVNQYTLDFVFTGERSGDEITENYGQVCKVKNRAFIPQQKVVIEEFTGMDCANCPLGILAFENLKKLYGNKVIPITLHCYQSDPLGQGLYDYAQFLGFNAAPSGRVNRGVINFPMLRVEGDYRFNGAGVETSDGSDPRVWADYVGEEFDNGTDIQLTVTSTLNGREFGATCSVNSALNLEGAALNIFGVVTEDGLENKYQMNNLYSSEDPDLGEFGKGGIYGMSIVRDFKNDDVARMVYGETYQGSQLSILIEPYEAGVEKRFTIAGDIPESVKDPRKAKVIMMLIDAVSGKIVNADAVYANGDPIESGIESIDGESASLQFNAGRGIISVLGQGTVTAEAYALDGTKLASVSGNDYVNIELPAGVVIVKATDANGAKAAKTMIR